MQATISFFIGMTPDIFFARLEQLRSLFVNCGAQHACALFDVSWKAGIEALERMIFMYRGTELEARLVADPRFEVYAAYFREVFYAWELACEHETHEQLTQQLQTLQQEYVTQFFEAWDQDASLGAAAATQTPATSPLARILETFPPVARTFAYASRECASLEDDSSFVHVGSGPCPESVLAVRQMIAERGLHCAITAVDQDPEAMNKASTLLRLSRLQGEIATRVLAADQLDFSGFTHILLAVMVRPEYFVLRRIVETASTVRPVEVLARTVSGLGSLIYAPLSTASVLLLEQAGFRMTQEISGHTIMKTLVYRRG